MRDLKASVFSTIEQPVRTATCAHRWTELDEAQCAGCGTYRGNGKHDASPASVRDGEQGEGR